MIFSTTLLGLAALAGTVSAKYVRRDTFDKNNFYKEFDFFNAADPTHGFVNYVNGQTANDKKLAGYAQDQIYLGVDYKSKNVADPGRMSVRVTSKKTYDNGLFIFDVTHMPVGCGVWPAIWTFGPNWPNSGEIDVIEGVHNADFNAVALHTGNGCTTNNAGSMYEGKKPLEQGGFCGAPGGIGTTGCSQKTDVGNSYGKGFNKIKGGVYAMEWTDTFVAVWFFPRGSVPDVANPNPSSWPKPMAKFVGCDIKKFFKQHNIIINITFCGDWAGNADVWNSQNECKAKADTCKAFVANNPDAFHEAYWQIKSITVFGAQ